MFIHDHIPLAHLVNNVLATGNFPSELKLGKIAHDINNSRPILLLRTMSKVVEKNIKTRIVAFINSTFNLTIINMVFSALAGL